MATGTYPDMLVRGVATVAKFVPFELWAGESDMVTSQGTAAVAIPQFTPIMRDPATKLITPCTAGTDKAIGFTAQPAAQGGPVVYYTGGVPNHEALLWPNGVTTLDARKAMFDGSNITVSSLL